MNSYPLPLRTCCRGAGLLLLATGGACAQEAIYNVGVGVSAAEAALTHRGVPETLFQWGPLVARPRASIGALYDSNIQLRPRGDEREDFVFTASPGITLGLGDLREGVGNLVGVDYAATFVAFEDNDELNSVDHAATLTAQWELTKLRLRLDHYYESAQGGVRDVGDFASWQIHTTTFNGRYDYSDKTAFGVQAAQQINEWEGDLNSFKEWRAQGYVDWLVAARVTTGIGVGARWRNVEGGPDVTAEQANLRAGYAVSDKTQVNASVGVEVQQFSEGEDPDPTPILSLSGAHRLFERTTLIMEAHRHNESSSNPDFAGQNVTVTGVMAGVRQDILAKLSARITVGYEDVDYEPLSSGATSHRQDSYLPVRADLEWRLTDNFTVAAMYTYRYNDSSVPLFDFEAHQVGLQVGYRF